MITNHHNVSDEEIYLRLKQLTDKISIEIKEPKQEFFDKYFPTVDDCTDYVVVIPTSFNPNRVDMPYEWLHESPFVNEICCFKNNIFEPYTPQFI